MGLRLLWRSCRADSVHMSKETGDRICGIWAEPKGNQIHLAKRTETGLRETHVLAWQPFAWSTSQGDNAEALTGAGALAYRRTFTDAAALTEATKGQRDQFEVIRPLEHQWLSAHQARLFAGMDFSELRRCTIDIETRCHKGFSDPKQKEDRVIAIGLHGPVVPNVDTVIHNETTLLTLEDDTDKAERALLSQFAEHLQAMDPDVLEGHNCFKFDFDYLLQRCRRFRLTPKWGRFGQRATSRSSRMRIAERWVDFPRCDIPGRAIFDTYLMVQLYDLTARALPGYGLKEVAVALGFSAANDRTYLDGNAIHASFDADREHFNAYLKDDLRETRALADLLLPTYVAQCRNLPMTLQEVSLRGTGAKVDAVLLETYHHANASLPEPQTVARYEGGFTRSFQTGVFDTILHYDVASLYPSLLLLLDRNPVGDHQGRFIPLLKQLRDERLRYKALAREAATEAMRQEYHARQASYKILINSFYGYLGFSGARFADGELAAEVTRQGRELLKSLIQRFEAEGATVLEADTDGIYVSAPQTTGDAEALLAKVAEVLPDGISLEFDGQYDRMFCYKAKNYALRSGEHVIIRGSALRSRGLEPILKTLTDQLIHYVLGLPVRPPLETLDALRSQIERSELPVEQLAKTEYLSQSPIAYEKAIAAGGKPRRASLEVALQLSPQPRMGEPVRYFITQGDKKRMPDWQVARPLAQFDPLQCPYDPAYYLRKLTDWQKRYSEFLEGPSIHLP